MQVSTAAAVSRERLLWLKNWMLRANERMKSNITAAKDGKKQQ